MKRTTSTPPSERPLNMDWAIRVYGDNQTVRCLVKSSPRRTLLTSAIVGLVMAIVGLTLTHPTARMPVTVESAPATAPLQLD